MNKRPTASDSIFPFDKIYVIGVSGVGKTNLANRISNTLKVPHVELDNLYWKKNWAGSDESEMLNKIQRELHEDNWVIDGRQNFTYDIVILPQTQVIIWLDLPLHVVSYRVLKRTIERAIKQRKLWAGNRENPWLAIVYWLRGTFIPYYRLRRKYFDQYTRSANLKPVLIRLRNSAQIKDFLDTL